jgi:hypothetical protein
MCLSLMNSNFHTHAAPPIRKSQSTRIPSKRPPMSSPLAEELVSAPKEKNQERYRELIDQGVDVNGADAVSDLQGAF